jgi:AraC-like DNA-binding protein
MPKPEISLPEPWREELGLGSKLTGAAWPHRAHQPGPMKLYHHHHPELELNLVLHGTARYLVADRHLRIDAGSLVWLFPGQVHCLYARSHDFRMHIAVWGSSLVTRAGIDPVLSQANPPGIFSRVVPLAAARQLSQLMQEVARGTNHSESTTDVAGMTFLLARAWQIFQAAPMTEASLELHSAVAQAARLIAEDPGRTLADLAIHTHMHTDHLGKLFRRQMGMSVVAYRNRHRLERVAQSWHAKASFLHLALSSGFGSYNQFHRAFSLHFGCSPRTWAAQCPATTTVTA